MTNLKTDIQKLAEIVVQYKPQIKASERTQINGSIDAEKAFRSLWRQPLELKECFYAMYLNRANKVLGILLISEGGLSGTVVDVRTVFQVGLKANASSVILAHNHPSGNDQPSEADKNITCKMKEAGKFLDILVLDHIILLPEGYMSFADNGF